ncbi:MAG TPA: hypothetical protein ENK18_08660 [Deltaproteobacteria bacterium]|nr:hypothetical protein [Deltaproteobacteria bacterium]
MKILVVGAGAVGQTLGYHLARGGAEVSFLIKPEHASAAEGGYTLYDLGAGGRAAPLSFTDLTILTSIDQLQGERFDMVLITVSSSALRSGSWLAELVAAAGEATICGLQPGLGDWDHVRGIAGADRVVWGLIELIAYQAPLEGEQVPEPGIAFWIPRLLLFPFSGPDARTQAIVSAFRAGGLRSKQVSDTTALTATGAPFLNLHMAALESVGWSLSALRADRELLALSARAVGQATAVAAHELEIEVPLWVRLLRPWQVRLLLWAAPGLVPLELEAYLAFHFTKVGAQTQASLERWIDSARSAGLDHDALVQLRDRWAASQDRAAQGSAGDRLRGAL